jgi:TonB-dependent receptor
METMPRYANIFAALLAALGCTHGASVAAAEPLEEIVVTGQRLAQQRSIQGKRVSPSVVERVSADDMGKLPDRNLAEAVGHLAGTSLTLDQGQGRFVAIRGLHSSINHFTINGMSAGSPEAEGGGRRVPLDVIGGELVEAVEVVKIRTPDMDGQGIGGTINVVLAGPLEQALERPTSASFRAGYDELNGKWPYGGEFTTAHANEGRTWGWLFGASHSSRQSETRGIYQDDWSTTLAADGSSAILPQNAMNALYDIERRRNAVHGAIEWRPSDDSRYFARGFFSAIAEDETRLRHESFFREEPQHVTPTGGASTASEREQDLRFEHKDKRFLNFSLGGAHTLRDMWQFDYAAQVNDNEQSLPSRSWEWRAQGRGVSQWMIDERGLVDVTAQAADFDPARFEFLRFRTRAHSTQERSYLAAMNLQRAFAGTESFLKIGVKYMRTERSNDADQSLYAPGANGWTLADLGQRDAVLVNSVAGMRHSNMAVDLAAANTFFDAHSHDDAYFDIRERDTFAAHLQADYAVCERVLAAYVMTSWDFGRGNLTAGVRAERTDLDTAGYQLDIEAMSARRAADAGYYTNVLPSLAGRFDVTDAVVLRAAWTHSIGRPDYEQLAPISVLDRDGNTGLLSIGNPDLQARKSTNYDVALEWYFNPSGLLAAAAFRKRIESEIVSRFQTFDDFVFDGEAFDRFTITTTQNADFTEVNGWELSYQQQFDSLPAPFDGLGVALTYAALHSQTHVTGRNDAPPLTRQPDWTRSATLFYQKAGVELALAFSEADSYLAEISDAPHTDLYAREYGRLDLRASYSLRERYRLFFEWHNINDEPAVEYQGGSARQKTQVEVYGQTWYLGLTVRL